jgi:hypothetical protein
MDKLCRRLGPELSAYADGELSGAERESLEDHLAGCAACSAELRATRKLQALLKSAESPLRGGTGIGAKLVTRLLGPPGGNPIDAGAWVRKGRRVTRPHS